LHIDYLQFAMEAVGVVVLSIFGLYAVRLLASFRKGMLERGWRLVTAGAIVLAAAQIPFLVAVLIGPPDGSILSSIGNFSRFGGIVLITIGFREQYRIWHIDKKDRYAAPHQTEETITP
jgi:hypothetical protein